MAIRRAVVAGNTTTFTTEMCHEEIPHRDRVDLAAYHPRSRECQRGPCFAVEPRIRRQRLLTTPEPTNICARRLNMVPPRRPSGTRETAAPQRKEAANESDLSRRPAGHRVRPGVV